jgi:ABC-type transport system substrate-binding protein
VLRGLYTIDNDGNWVPDLGTEVPSVANGGLVVDPAGGFTLTLKMKPGLKWSDGAAMTMNDFKWTYDWAVAAAIAGLGCSGCGSFVPVIDTSLEGDAYYGADNQYVSSITVSADGLAATVVFRKNYAGWLGWAATAPLPPQFWKDVLPENLAKAAAVDSPDLAKIPWSGPFVITAGSAALFRRSTLSASATTVRRTA